MVAEITLNTILFCPDLHYSSPIASSLVAGGGAGGRVEVLLFGPVKNMAKNRCVL
jgi:hypothetical protein